MKKGMNNKGFSLVELIIVVAIMAVLVGVLAPQYIKYLDKSKVGIDQQMCDNLRQAMVTTYLDPNVAGGAAAETATASALGASSAENDFWDEVYEIMGANDAAAVKAMLALDPANGTITYTLNNQGVARVIVSGGKYQQYPIDVE